MVMMTVGMGQMKRVVQPGTVSHGSSSVALEGVYHHVMHVMTLITVEMEPMRLQLIHSAVCVEF